MLASLFFYYMCVLSFYYQGEYQRGVNAWNFDIEDLKAQVSQVSKNFWYRSIFKIFLIGMFYFEKILCYLDLSCIYTKLFQQYFRCETTMMYWRPRKKMKAWNRLFLIRLIGSLCGVGLEVLIIKQMLIYFSFIIGRL